MISTIPCPVNARIIADTGISGGPWIPPPKRKRRTGHPRWALSRRLGPPPISVRFPCHFGPSGHQTTPALSTVLTETPQLDSSYEATTPSRLDLVLRQRAQPANEPPPEETSVVLPSLPVASSKNLTI